MGNDTVFCQAAVAIENWLTNRFSSLLSRLYACGAEFAVDETSAMSAYHKFFSLLSPVERPISLTYDDPKPDSLIFTEDTNKPHIVDMESFTVGHRIIDGIGRGMYWGPIREPLKGGELPDHNAKHKVVEAYNVNVPESWRISFDTVDLWCIASELFWLPDVAATHTIAPFLPAAKLQGTQIKLQRFSNLLQALQNEDIEQAKKITFS